jgi:hypothetical protein
LKVFQIANPYNRQLDQNPTVAAVPQPGTGLIEHLHGCQDILEP